MSLRKLPIHVTHESLYVKYTLHMEGHKEHCKTFSGVLVYGVFRRSCHELPGSCGTNRYSSILIGKKLHIFVHWDCKRHHLDLGNRGNSPQVSVRRSRILGKRSTTMSAGAKRSTYGTKLFKDSVEFTQVGEVFSLTHNQGDETSRIMDGCKQKINTPRINSVI